MTETIEGILGAIIGFGALFSPHFRLKNEKPYKKPSTSNWGLLETFALCSLFVTWRFSYIIAYNPGPAVTNPEAVLLVSRCFLGGEILISSIFLYRRARKNSNSA